MLIGKIGCGKTTLCQRLFDEEIKYKKTQTVQVLGGTAIDTPGEYMEHRAYYKALIVTSVEADMILFLHSANDDQFVFSPRMTSMFNKPAIGIITKTDLCKDEQQLKHVRDALEYAGAVKIFEISSYTGEGVKELSEFLEDANLNDLQ